MKSDSTLTELIYNASDQAFGDWRKANPTERVFAFALSTLDDAIYVNASLNSEESHQRRLVERQLDPESVYGRDTKWGPWEWENEYTGQIHFASVTERLKRMYDECRGAAFAEFRSTVFDSMLQALVKLREDSVVTNDGDPSGIVMFATIYDSLSAESLHRRSAELLNPADAITELLSVIGGGLTIDSRAVEDRTEVRIPTKKINKVADVTMFRVDVPSEPLYVFLKEDPRQNERFPSDYDVDEVTWEILPKDVPTFSPEHMAFATCDYGVQELQPGLIAQCDSDPKHYRYARDKRDLTGFKLAMGLVFKNWAEFEELWNE